MPGYVYRGLSTRQRYAVMTPFLDGSGNLLQKGQPAGVSEVIVFVNNDDGIRRGTEGPVSPADPYSPTALNSEWESAPPVPINLLSANAASMEASIADWVSSNGAGYSTLAQSPDVALDGSHSLAVTIAGHAGANFYIAQIANASCPPAATGTLYNGQLAVQLGEGNTGGGVVYAALFALDVNNNILSSPAGINFQAVKGGWVVPACQLNPPVNTAKLSLALGLVAAAVGDVYYIDEAMIAVAPKTNWTPGGQ